MAAKKQGGHCNCVPVIIPKDSSQKIDIAVLQQRKSNFETDRTIVQKEAISNAF